MWLIAMSCRKAKGSIRPPRGKNWKKESGNEFCLLGTGGGGGKKNGFDVPLARVYCWSAIFAWKRGVSMNNTTYLPTYLW